MAARRLLLAAASRVVRASEQQPQLVLKRAFVAAAACNTKVAIAESSQLSRLSAFAVATSTLGFAAYAYHDADPPTVHADSPAPAQVPVDQYAPPKHLTGHVPKEVVLYQYEVCPFCNKVRAFLDYHKIPYQVVEVNPLTKAELKFSQYKKVPVVIMDGEQLNDSTAIISRLDAEIAAIEKGKEEPAGKLGWLAGIVKGKKDPTSAGTSPEEVEKWRRWVDDWFVRVITVNIYRTAHESWQTFNYITETGNFNWANRQAARVSGATMMYALSGRLKKKYHIEGDVREALYTSADQWVDAVGDKPFNGGAKPNLADLAVFGVIRSVVGTDTFHDLLHKTRIAPWYERMMKVVGDSARRV